AVIAIASEDVGLPSNFRSCTYFASASTLRELRGCVPHGSLPPCGGGTGRGVQRPLRLFEIRCPCACVSHGEPYASCLVATPLPVPPPQGGRERCGSALHNQRTQHLCFVSYCKDVDQMSARAALS